MRYIHFLFGEGALRGLSVAVKTTGMLSCMFASPRSSRSG
jgi:hypothetical protein